MGITPRFTPQQLAQETQRQLRGIENGIINALNQAGFEFMRDARANVEGISGSAFPKGNYQDHTTNLRSSVGFFVLRNGSVIQAQLEGTGEGTTAARALLEIVPKFPKGYQLVGVAGMDYASYVESKGYNVITSQADATLVNLDKYLKDFAASKNISGFDMNTTGVSTAMKAP